MVVTLRSGRELEEMRVEKKDNEENKHVEIEKNLSSTVQNWMKKIKQQKCSKWKRKSREKGKG